MVFKIKEFRGIKIPTSNIPKNMFTCISFNPKFQIPYDPAFLIYQSLE